MIASVYHVFHIFICTHILKKVMLLLDSPVYIKKTKDIVCFMTLILNQIQFRFQP